MTLYLNPTLCLDSWSSRFADDLWCKSTDNRGSCILERFYFLLEFLFDFYFNFFFISSLYSLYSDLQEQYCLLQCYLGCERLCMTYKFTGLFCLGVDIAWLLLDYLFDRISGDFEVTLFFFVTVFVISYWSIWSYLNLFISRQDCPRCLSWSS